MNRSLLLAAASVAVVGALAGGCTSPMASRAAAEVIVSSLRAGDADDRVTMLTTGVLGLMWSETRASRGSHAPTFLREAADPLARCGQDRDDVLDLRVHAVVGGWPWQVEVRQATPGAEGCVAAVAAQLPLDVDLWRGARYLAVRTTLAELAVSEAADGAPPSCHLSHEVHATIRSTARMELPLDDAGALAFRVTCPDEAPLTELTVDYARGRLAAATTDPPVPCVEANAAEHLAAVDTLGLPKTGAAALPPTASGWDAVRCTLPVPLRAP